MSTPQKLSIFSFHLLFLSLLPLKITSSQRTQAEALIQWKNTLLFSPVSLNSWSTANINNLCNWTAIACDNTGIVSEVNLFNANIIRMLNQFNFIQFSNLTRFDPKNNSLSGPIPSAINNLSKLILLDLSNNSLEGNIPLMLG
ncbi:Leucine-rich repeat-containing N-terminal [Theobroma cacao]|nr:Leucine-rich repeat-containing N-terminal [Theobroma cacao]